MKSMTARARHLTVRGLPPEVARALAREKRKRGTSLNQTAIDLLRGALGIDGSAPRRNGLERLAGTWAEADLEQMQQATAAAEMVDDDLWR